MAEQAEKKLQVRHLRISFRTNGGKVQAVRDISFDLNRGETLAIVGESGSGKSVTSKAILGILAGNSIIEGGEILYDGQDLLKISEDDFYRIRGDKIAMIFQDPLSSLNPIMRIGKQLTEAMLLKGKARQKSSRKNFNSRLKLLEGYMKDACGAEKSEEISRLISTFDKTEMEDIRLEGAYNVAREAAEELCGELEETMFQLSKNAFTDREYIREIAQMSGQMAHEKLLCDEGDRKAAADLSARLKKEGYGPFNRLTKQKKQPEICPILSEILALAKKADATPAPDFLAIAYNKLTGGAPLTDEEMEQRLQNELTGKMLEYSEKAFECADKKFLEKRQAAEKSLESAIQKLNGCSVEEFAETAKALEKEIDSCIDPIDIVKDSAACTFTSSMEYFLKLHNQGRRKNASKQKKYDKAMAKYQKRAAKGKDWKVPAPTIINLELNKANIVSLMERLLGDYRERNEQEQNSDKRRKAEDMMAFLKENASGSVARITKRAAKAKALKLMAEVGISEARKRYRQYPFEFSGGMRQRIVIAIALAANPDILICDEPTTALDVTIQAQILELINKLKEERHLSIIFITHDLGVVANMADRIAVMYAGKIVEYGTSEEIFYSPAHPYTWALLSSMPDLDSKDKLEAIPGTPPNMIFPPKGDAFAQRNRYAMEIDFEREPPEFPISDTHWAATWLRHPNAPHVDPPKAVCDRIAKMKARIEQEEAKEANTDE